MNILFPKIRLPDGFNYPVQQIMFVFIAEELFAIGEEAELAGRASRAPRYVKLVLEHDPLEAYPTLDDWIQSQTPALWQGKYGELPPEQVSFYGIWAEALGPGVVPYDGPTRLESEEQTTLYSLAGAARTGMTMAMLYVMVEGFGWRPGANYQSRTWPRARELVSFWHHFAAPVSNDPAGSLAAALMLLDTRPDGHCDSSRDVLDMVVTDVGLAYDELARGSVALACV